MFICIAYLFIGKGSSTSVAFLLHLIQMCSTYA